MGCEKAIELLWQSKRAIRHILSLWAYNETECNVYSQCYTEDRSVSTTNNEATAY